MMACPFWTPQARITLARFDGESAKRLGMLASFNPHPPGPARTAWAEGWDSIPVWRRSDFLRRRGSEPEEDSGDRVPVLHELRPRSGRED